MYLRILYHLWIKILVILPLRILDASQGKLRLRSRTAASVSFLTFYCLLLGTHIVTGKEHSLSQAAHHHLVENNLPYKVTWGEFWGCIQVSFQWPHQLDVQVHAWVLIERRVQTQLRCDPSHEHGAFVLWEPRGTPISNHKNMIQVMGSATLLLWNPCLVSQFSVSLPQQKN